MTAAAARFPRLAPAPPPRALLVFHVFMFHVFTLHIFPDPFGTHKGREKGAVWTGFFITFLPTTTHNPHPLHHLHRAPRIDTFFLPICAHPCPSQIYETNPSPR